MSKQPIDKYEVGIQKVNMEIKSPIIGQLRTFMIIIVILLGLILVKVW